MLTCHWSAPPVADSEGRLNSRNQNKMWDYLIFTHPGRVTWRMWPAEWPRTTKTDWETNSLWAKIQKDGYAADAVRAISPCCNNVEFARKFCTILPSFCTFCLFLHIYACFCAFFKCKFYKLKVLTVLFFKLFPTLTMGLELDQGPETTPRILSK